MEAYGMAVYVPSPADIMADFSLAKSLLEDPCTYYDTLRADLPVFYAQSDQCYVLSRYQDVRALLQDYELYDSRQGSLQSREVKKDDLDFEPIFVQSPPDHTRLRKLGAKAYSIASAARIDASSRAIAARLLDALDDKVDRFDLVADYAEPLAVQSVLSFLEFPESDIPELHGLLKQSFSRADSSASSNEHVGGITARLAKHFFAAKNGSVGGFPSDIVHAELNGDTFSNGEAFGMLVFAMAGGTEDMVRAVGNIAYALSTNREQRRLLLEDVDGRINAAIAESLRLYPTSQYLRRVTTRAVTLHGVTMAQGSSVVGLLGAANRDERMFKNAARFEIDRSNTSASLTFGTGPHVCIGKNFAKVILKGAVLELLKRYPDYELDLQQASKTHNAPIVGYDRLGFITGR